jgi:hypothetical protein
MEPAADYFYANQALGYTNPIDYTSGIARCTEGNTMVNERCVPPQFRFRPPVNHAPEWRAQMAHKNNMWKWLIFLLVILALLFLLCSYKR